MHFLALPCSNLAVEEYEYYAMTYPDRRPELTSDVLIVGCEDNTLVTTLSNTITLNRLETYLIQSFRFYWHESNFHKTSIFSSVTKSVLIYLQTLVLVII